MMSLKIQASFFIMCLSPFLITFIIHFNAYGDGCCYSSVTEYPGNKIIHPSIKFEPHFLYLESTQEKHVQIKFFDAKADTPIKSASFFLNVTKGNQLLMYDLFYTQNGTIELKFQPGGTVGKWKVYGDQEPTGGGWTSTTNQVNVQAPILSEDGLYHFNIELVGFGYPNTMIPPFVSKIKFNKTVIVDNYPPPLKQIKSGSLLSEVKCTDGFILVINSEGSFPACVRSQTAQKLVERGWGTLISKVFTSSNNLYCKNPTFVNATLFLNPYSNPDPSFPAAIISDDILVKYPILNKALEFERSAGNVSHVVLPLSSDISENDANDILSIWKSNSPLSPTEKEMSNNYMKMVYDLVAKHQGL